MKMKFSVVFSILLLALPVWAAGDGVPAATVISQISNLGILILGLYFTQRKTIAKMFSEKKEQFLAHVEESSRFKKEAEDKLHEVTKRVTDMGESFDEQIEAAKKNAEEAYRVQLADAKNEAVRLKTSAKTSLEFEIQREIENLRIETFQKSASVAEENLSKKLTPDQMKAWNSHFAAGEKGAH